MRFGAVRTLWNEIKQEAQKFGLINTVEPLITDTLINGHLQ